MNCIKLADIKKTFETRGDFGESLRRVNAVDGISLSFFKNEIHAVLGENGAGKSTLMHLLTGLQVQSKGSIQFDDFFFSAEKPLNPKLALKHKIVMVHQRPLLVENLSVIENCLIGNNTFFVTKKNLEKINHLAQEWSLSIPLTKPVRSLTSAERFYTSLLSVLLYEPDFLIIDEPASVLSESEHEFFFTALKQHSQKGLGVIFITHRISEALTWADKISVMRNGHLIFSDYKNNSASNINAEQLETLIDPTGIARKKNTPKKSTQPKETIHDYFSVHNLSVYSTKRQSLPKISFNLNAGSISAIYGKQGSPLSVLEDALSGMVLCTSGRITLDSSILTTKDLTPAKIQKAGIALVPSNRSFRGSNPNLTILELLNAHQYQSIMVHTKENIQFALRILLDENINASLRRKTSTLSGGQLQRLVLARELARKPKVLILSEPEWGLDIQSAAHLRQKLLKAAESGCAVLILTDNPDSLRDPDFFSTVLLLDEVGLI